jgi:hypothetical protein
MFTANVFALVSWGAAATNWVAQALNSHPSIFCVHQANLAIHKHFGLTKLLTGFDYMNALTVLGDDYPVVGDVHGLDRSEAPLLREKAGKLFNCGVLVREPIARLRSSLALYRRHNFETHEDYSYLLGIAQQMGLDYDDLSQEQRVTLHAVQMLNAVVDEAAVGPFFRMEDLTTRPSALVECARYLSGGVIDVDFAWAETALQIPRKNRHSTKASNTLDEWAMRAVDAIVTPGAWQIYESLGYARPNGNVIRPM